MHARTVAIWIYSILMNSSDSYVASSGEVEQGGRRGNCPSTKERHCPLKTYQSCNVVLVATDISVV